MSHASALIAPWAKTSSSLRGEGVEFVGGGDKRLAGEIRKPPRRPRCRSPSGAFSPVPTAVPPSASSCRRVERAAPAARRSRCRLERQPEISWLKRDRGRRPASGFCRSSRRRSFSALQAAGRSRSERPRRGSAYPQWRITAAMCIAVGKVSLEDWLMLTSSFGWSSFSSPRDLVARLAQ